MNELGTAYVRGVMKAIKHAQSALGGTAGVAATPAAIRPRPSLKDLAKPISSSKPQLEAAVGPGVGPYQPK